MKISAFTFIRNGDMLGYPYIASIKSVLPLVDEFIVNVGPSEDDTLENVKAINSDKIKILQTPWNEEMKTRGYVYGQQKMVAQFNCTGDWAFYIEGDEVVHEDDLEILRQSMLKYKDDDRVEALTVNYTHFYGNKNTYLWSPSWNRDEPRIIKNNIRTYAPDGLYWIVLKSKKIGRYPYAVKSGAKMYHYGWMRSEEQTDLKSQKISKYWNHKANEKKTDYTQIDPITLKEFKDSHPKVVQEYLPDAKGIQKTDSNYKITRKDKRNRILLKLENWFGFDFTKHHWLKAKI